VLRLDVVSSEAALEELADALDEQRAVAVAR
jgi:hypothetical protein